MAKSAWRISIAAGFLWLFFLLFCGDTPTAVWRSTAPTTHWAAAHRQGRALRVITLNCGGGNPAAAAEVAQYQPDIVLLQESPAERDVAALAQRLFKNHADYVWGIDASIVTDGKLLPRPHAQMRADFTRARVRLRSGITCDVDSLRLQPPVFRTDLNSPDCWREQCEDRIAHRHELADIWRLSGLQSSAERTIVAGDFNTPAGDAVFRVLQPRLHDAFAEGGAGWGNTAINDLPFARIDQLWISHNLCAVRVVARQTRNSDHRMVICDLAIPR